MANITVSHADSTLWKLSEKGISRLAGAGTWIDYQTPEPLMTIAAGSRSDDIYALQDDQTLLHLVRSPVEMIPESPPYFMMEISVGKDGTICGLLDQFGDGEYMPYAWLKTNGVYS